ncbi:unnamed protein product [Schistosoma margrebowiei]|uniref:Uncharacterized protein n=1 Tax=Schistosoma margrebowiei TaxID=48269 RepID=A0A183MPZ4_9TREM|nr:unnamed protein product [Schistosoma margrebowiei]
MEDVRTKRGADIASNHHLPVVKMKLKLKKHKFNTAFLRDTDKLNKFKIALSNRFQAFHDLLNGEGTTMESNWMRKFVQCVEDIASIMFRDDWGIPTSRCVTK